MAILTGTAPVSEMRDYQKEFAAYTGGFGKLSCTLGGYDVCHNAEEMVEAAAYDPDGDIENPADSVFCSHGAGIIVPWYQVEEQMHMESILGPDAREQEREVRRAARPVSRNIELTQEELDAIYVRTPDPVRRSVSSTPGSGRRRRSFRSKTEKPPGRISAGGRLQYHFRVG